MTTPDYRYAIELHSSSGAVLGQVPVTPDWTAALESAAFEGIRRGHLPAVLCTPEGAVEPIWHGKLGAPYVSGFRVLGAGGFPWEISTAYMRPHAVQASTEFVEKELLEAGETFTYLVCAFSVSPLPPEAPPSGFSIEDVARPLPLGSKTAAELLRSSVPHGEVRAEDVAAFVPQEVLDEAADLARRAGDVETGGVLLGKLHRDPAGGDLLVEITAQLPAPHTVSQAASLTFTPDTWAAVDRALALRRRGELMLGWWHYHPDFCRKCPPENRRRCHLSSDLLQRRGREPAPHLLRSRLPRRAVGERHTARAGLSWSMFAWRRGTVEARGFYVLQADRGGGLGGRAPGLVMLRRSARRAETSGTTRMRRSRMSMSQTAEARAQRSAGAPADARAAVLDGRRLTRLGRQAGVDADDPRQLARSRPPARPAGTGAAGPSARGGVRGAAESGAVACSGGEPPPAAVVPGSSGAVTRRHSVARPGHAGRRPAHRRLRRGHRPERARRGRRNLPRQGARRHRRALAARRTPLRRDGAVRAPCRRRAPRPKMARRGGRRRSGGRAARRTAADGRSDALEPRRLAGAGEDRAGRGASVPARRRSRHRPRADRRPGRQRRDAALGSDRNPRVAGERRPSTGSPIDTPPCWSARRDAARRRWHRWPRRRCAA